MVENKWLLLLPGALIENKLKIRKANEHFIYTHFNSEKKKKRHFTAALCLPSTASSSHSLFHHLSTPPLPRYQPPQTIPFFLPSTSLPKLLRSSLVFLHLVFDSFCRTVKLCYDQVLHHPPPLRLSSITFHSEKPFFFFLGSRLHILSLAPAPFSSISCRPRDISFLPDTAPTYSPGILQTLAAQRLVPAFTRHSLSPAFRVSLLITSTKP